LHGRPQLTVPFVARRYQFWIHTQLVPPLPLVETIFNTPSLHKM
jgi:hypothetical protein